MVSISIQPKERLEGASNFNTWKERVLRILEEQDLDVYVTLVSEESLSNVGIIKEQVNMHHFITFQETKFLQMF